MTGTSPIVPQPDPTALTTAQLDRGLTSLRELTEIRLAAIEAQAEASENQIREVGRERLANVLDRVATLSTSIDARFAERDVRTEQTANGVSKALDAALRAVEAQNLATATAITKSELSLVRQVDAVAQIQATALKILTDKIDDLRTRQDRSEAVRAGIQETRIDRRADSGSIIAVVSAAILGLTLVVAILGFAVLHH